MIQDGSRQRQLVTWVAEKHARVGARLTCDSAPEVWGVYEVYRALPQPEKWVTDRRKAHERWRSVTDV